MKSTYNIIRTTHIVREREGKHQWNLRNIGPQPYEVSNEVDSFYSRLLLTCALGAMSSMRVVVIYREK